MHALAPPTLRLAGLALVLLVLLAGLAVGQDEPPVPAEPPHETESLDGAQIPATGEEIVIRAAAVFAETKDARARAFERLEARDWAGCLAAFDEVVTALEPVPLLGGFRDQCLYNVACANARMGRPEEAVKALAACLEHGLRPVATPTEDGRVVIGAGLSFAHILVDSDLDSLRERDDFHAVLDGLLRAGEPLVLLTAAAQAMDAPTALPGVVIALPEDRDVDSGATIWGAALADVPAVVAIVAGPVRPSPRSRRWLLVDGDERFAVAKIDEALDALRSHANVDPSRVYMAALSAPAGQGALAAALARPRDVAGLALGPFRFHAAWHADALHDLAAARQGLAPWRVSFFRTGDTFESALTAAGVEGDPREPPPPIVPPEQRGAALRETLVAGLLDLLR